MPLAMSSETREALRARRIAIAWLLELYTDEGTLRSWSQRDAMTFEGNTFEAGVERWGISSELKCGRDLVPQPLVLWLDGVGQLDGASFTGRLLARKWHTRPIRLRQLICAPMTNFRVPIGIAYDWRGFMDTIDAAWGASGPLRIVLNCESGTFRSKGRNMTTLTDADQRRRDPNDGSFRNTALKGSQDIPFGDNWSNIAGSGADGGGMGVSSSSSNRRYG